VDRARSDAARSRAAREPRGGSSAAHAVVLARASPEQPMRPGVARLAVYAGSFDPPTLGHLDLIERASALFSDVIVGIGRHATRTPLFSVEERVDLVSRVSSHLPNVAVEAFDGLLIDYCKLKKARVIVRGLRAATDFEYELQIAHANADLGPEVDTVFLPTRTMNGFISASLVREIASHGGDATRYAPKLVCQALAKKFAR
jgi:pantetheine-phosphate adenylyltransferase